jgi:hypothetical protein
MQNTMQEANVLINPERELFSNESRLWRGYALGKLLVYLSGHSSYRHIWLPTSPLGSF